MADIWRGANGIWTLAYESCLLGVETEGLCQRGAALETSVREKTGGWPRKNRKKRPGLGALMLSGLRKTLSILPSASGSLSLGSHLTLGHYTVHKTKCLKDTTLSVANWNSDIFGALFWYISHAD